MFKQDKHCVLCSSRTNTVYCVQAGRTLCMVFKQDEHCVLCSSRTLQYLAAISSVLWQAANQDRLTTTGVFSFLKTSVLEPLPCTLPQDPVLCKVRYSSLVFGLTHSLLELYHLSSLPVRYFYLDACFNSHILSQRNWPMYLRDVEVYDVAFSCIPSGITSLQTR
jgi:hypothetical protein